jgi:hypothetical protein
VRAHELQRVAVGSCLVGLGDELFLKLECTPRKVLHAVLQPQHLRWRPEGDDFDIAINVVHCVPDPELVVREDRALVPHLVKRPPHHDLCAYGPLSHDGKLCTCTVGEEGAPPIGSSTRWQHSYMQAVHACVYAGTCLDVPCERD